MKRSFYLQNKTNGYVAFKVKSSRPSIFWANPNFGVLEPSSSFEVVVTRYAVAHALSVRNPKEEIIVQSVSADGMLVKNIRDVTDLMKEPKKLVCEVTIPVVYLKKGEGSKANTILSKHHLGKSEKLEEDDDEVIPVCTQNANEMDDLFLAEEFKRNKIETELSNVKKELEENELLLQKIIATHTQTSNEMKALLHEKEQSLKKIKEELAEVRKSCCIEFKFEELKEATNNFDETEKLGEGNFAVVYKGKLHHTPVAIKKLKEKERDERGFNEEIETLSKVRHPHLVTLIGACRDAKNPALVYEYLPGGSLEDHLSSKNKPPLNGQTRIRIALEICSALCFLHSTLKSHGDIKPDNILLDYNYVSKLSDFGTCRQLKHTPGTITPSYETLNVTGTFAYMDPDYLSSGKMTPSFDVYSFGLVLLRLATGKGLYDDHQKMPLRDIVETAIECKNFEKLVDVKWPSKQTPEKIAKLGLLCVERTKAPLGQPIRPNARTLFQSLWDIAGIDQLNDLHIGTEMRIQMYA